MRVDDIVAGLVDESPFPRQLYRCTPGGKWPCCRELDRDYHPELFVNIAPLRADTECSAAFGKRAYFRNAFRKVFRKCNVIAYGKK